MRTEITDLDLVGGATNFPGAPVALPICLLFGVRLTPRAVAGILSLG